MHIFNDNLLGESFSPEEKQLIKEAITMANALCDNRGYCYIQDAWWAVHVDRSEHSITIRHINEGMYDHKDTVVFSCEIDDSGWFQPKYYHVKVFRDYHYCDSWLDIMRNKYRRIKAKQDKNFHP